MVDRRQKVRKEWIKKYGQIADKMELHHIIPIHSGGTDDLTNICCITIEEHAKLHLKLYNTYGNFRDLCAYHMICYNFTEAHRISSSEGGKIGGKKSKELKVGIFKYDINSEEYRQKQASGGRVGGKKQAELGLGFHKYKTDPELHRQWGRKGGISCGKRGGVKNRGKRYVTDGTIERKVPGEQLEKFLEDNKSFIIGRLKGYENKINKKM